MNKGKFIILEGFDGSGKSTAILFLEKYLKEKGIDVIRTREPGGTPEAEQIRNLVLNNKLNSLAELLLFNAARVQHLNDLIIPNINNGKIVLCDRFNISTNAYQGYGRGLNQTVEDLDKIVIDNFKPDHTLFFNISFETAISRAQLRNTKDVFENEIIDFKQRVYNGYLDYREEAVGVYYIDAEQTIPEVEQQLIAFVNDTLKI